ncbi:MAG TPA: hypothetical protein DCR55_07445 [Lentisphaeria bacterium]|nr:hypothetical protein [Lentisphaeria bacterium]
MFEIKLDRHAPPVFALFVVAFVYVSVPLVRSDLWFDEIVTLFDWVLHDDWQRIFRNYPVANNHILYSAMLWAWMHLFAGNPNALTESVLRVPSLLCALVGLLICYRRISALYGHSRGLVLGCMLCTSPILLTFATQMRGYGLTFALSAAATCGILDIYHGNHRRGVMMACPALILLPMAIPSNLLLNAGLVVFLLLSWQQMQRKSILVLLLVVVCAGLGALVYLPVHEQFLAVVQKTGNFGSSTKLLGHLALAAIAHCGLLAACVLILRRGRARAEGDSSCQHLLMLGACCLVPFLALAIVKAPFPRVSLMYLVPFSLAFLPLVPKNLLDDGRDLLYVLFFLITNAVLVSAVSHNAREVALVEGKYPQDLLTQYYHGSRDVSSVARLLAHLEVTPPHSVIYCDIHLFPALRYYWVVAGRNAAQLQCLDGGRLFPLRVNPNELRFRPQILIGYSGAQAANQYLNNTGIHVRLQETLTVAGRDLGIFLAFPMPDREDLMPKRKNDPI